MPLSEEEQRKFLDNFDLDNDLLSEDEQSKLKSLLLEHRPAFACSAEELGSTQVTCHTIPTGEHKPVKMPPYRTPHHLKPVLKEQIESMLDNNIISPSSSPWSSPVVLVRKKDGSYRFCVDFRKLNAITERDSFPLPRIDDTFDCLGGAKFFSTLDLASGYWQIEMDPVDKQKTAFSTPCGHYEFNRKPFGLSNAPATFQRLMQLVLQDLTWEQALPYLDDVTVLSGSFDAQLVQLRQVFERFCSAGLTLKPTKCHFCKPNVHFLGHIVSGEGLAADPAKVAAVRDFPAPSNVTELKGFLGLSSYYRRFIHDDSTIAAPLNRLQERAKRWSWTEDCATAFLKLKSCLTNAPTLTFPCLSESFILFTDASATGLGAVLS